jgi:hypothetical protein
MPDQMNGNILANQGFINQFSDAADTNILDAQWVSAWGGGFAGALFLGQVAMVYVNDRFGRKIGLWVTWVIMASVSDHTRVVTYNSLSWQNRSLQPRLAGWEPRCSVAPVSVRCRLHYQCTLTRFHRRLSEDSSPKLTPCQLFWPIRDQR